MAVQNAFGPPTLPLLADPLRLRLAEAQPIARGLVCVAFAPLLFARPAQVDDLAHRYFLRKASIDTTFASPDPSAAFSDGAAGLPAACSAAGLARESFDGAGLAEEGDAD